MDFSFAVRSIGNSPLHDVKVSDDKCSPVSADPVTKTGGDEDALLEDGEAWTYTCTMTVPSHGAGEMDPLCNVATATGERRAGQDASATPTPLHGHHPPGDRGQEDRRTARPRRSATPSATASTSPTPVTPA